MILIINKDSDAAERSVSNTHGGDTAGGSIARTDVKVRGQQTTEERGAEGRATRPQSVS